MARGGSRHWNVSLRGPRGPRTGTGGTTYTSHTQKLTGQDKRDISRRAGVLKTLKTIMPRKPSK